jgi:hypothetical protein
VVVQLFYVLFSWAFFVVYYIDLRVRSEGLDLALEAESAGDVGKDASLKA